MNQFFTAEAIEAIKAGNRFKEFSDEFETEFKPRKLKKFFEIVVSFEELTIKKYELNFVYHSINLREKYLIVDRLFVDMSAIHEPYFGDPYKVAVEIEHFARSQNLISLKNLRVVECDWIEGILELFLRSPCALNMKKLAGHSSLQCGHEWTFDELLAKVAIGEYQESQRMSKVAQDALMKAPPPMIIIKDEAEIERLRIQYQPKEKL